MNGSKHSNNIPNRYYTQSTADYSSHPHPRPRPHPRPSIYPNQQQQLHTVNPSSANYKHPKNYRKGPYGANLFIFYIPPELDEDDLITLFCHFGNIISQSINKHQDGEPKGYGFISYDNPNSAQRAIEVMNGFAIGGKKLYVNLKREDNF